MSCQVYWNFEDYKINENIGEEVPTPLVPTGKNDWTLRSSSKGVQRIEMIFFICFPKIEKKKIFLISIRE